MKELNDLADNFFEKRNNFSALDCGKFSLEDIDEIEMFMNKCHRPKVSLSVVDMKKWIENERIKLKSHRNEKPRSND